jgi:hypothetical protein
VTRLRTTLAIVALLAPLSAYSAHAGGDPPAHSLDGKSFDGKIRGTGRLGLMRSKTIIEFKEGTFAWTTGEDFEPAPYETTEENGKIIFTARAAGKEGGAYVDDYADWSGVYNGESLSDVTAVWTRKEGGGNWLYDFLLPEVVTFIFEQE